ncbi:branched-chain amino acid ABC transporter permease [Amycolatopsis viridis]|uniref:Branched-chain amino acid transport system permease protein n=1 Tax=Amycolatopsis viridis TaxID=185678 RepID=A0ABX0SWE1_9PSEU|nr:branched-chain amino acid ABC transporter permease [Amycolatopsis viridis]NIH80940.1 branched-chain amino acid transport system permease protein [Amycolatopsis viridis]
MTTQTVSAPRAGRRSIRERWNNLSRPVQWAILVPLVVLIYFLPVLNPPLIATTGTDFPNAMFDVARYALVAIGLNVVVGQAGLLDLGYVGFFAVGAYVAALFTSPNSSLHHLPYLWTLPLAMVITMIFGIVLGTPTLRLRGDYLAIVTLGFGEIIRLVADNVGPLRGQSGFQGVGTSAAGVPFFANATQWYWLTITIIIAVLLLVGNLERSRVGRAWVSIREDEDVAEIMGVPVFKFKIWAFVIGAAIGGLSGALYAGKLGFVNNQSFDVITSMLFLAAVVLGGAGNKVGVLLGAIVVAYLPLRFVQLADYNYLIFGIALIILMIFRPQGLLGARQRLLARGRQAYHRLLGRGEQISGDSALAADTQGGRR